MKRRAPWSDPGGRGWSSRKPSSVSRVEPGDGHLSGMAVAGHLEQPTRGWPLALRARDRCGHTSPLIWPCSDWGLPCRRCCQRRGGLLPHRFTLTRQLPAGRSVLCCPVRRLAAPRSYLAVCPVELGLSSSRPRGRPATIALDQRRQSNSLPTNGLLQRARRPDHPSPSLANPRCACTMNGCRVASADFHWASASRYSWRASARRPSCS
jgi:hypothetical protein